MSTRPWAALAVSLSAAALLVATPGLAAASADAAQAPATSSVATLSWGVNNESSNSGFAPGTANFFSAGSIPNTGSSRLITEGEWSSQVGSVTVQKQNAAGGYAKATWAGLKTQPNGAPLGSPTTATFSNHRVQVVRGTGTYDAAADDADIRWTGSFTVIYYSGYTYYYVKNPRLQISGGVGTLTGVLGGYGTSMEDQSQWVKLPAKRVALAKFRGVDVTAGGLTATPVYTKVRYTLPSGSTGVPQVRTGATWGAFPQAFVDYQQRTGQHSYWYSSGGSTDAFKVPLPVSITF